MVEALDGVRESGRRERRRARDRRLLARRHRRLADELAAEQAVAARAAPPAQGGPRPRLPRRLPLGARARLRATCSRWTATSRTIRARVPSLLAAARAGADLVLGSRYCAGGRVENWGRARRLISSAGCLYARTLLGVGVRDLTGGFKCFRRAVLEAIELDAVDAQGYQFQIEMTYRALLLGFEVVEVPITFADRVAGGSKMSRSIVFEAMRRVPLLRLAGRARAAAAQRRRRPARRLLDSSDAAAREPCDRRGRGRSRRRRRRGARALVLRRAPAAERSAAGSGTGRPRRRCSCPVEHSGNLGDLRARVDGQRRGGEAAQPTGDGPRARARQRRATARTACASRPARAASSATASTRRSRFTSTRTARRWRSTSVPSGWQSASELSGTRRAGLDARAQLLGQARRHASAQRRVRARSRSCPTAARP